MKPPRPRSMPPPGAASTDVLRVVDMLVGRGLYGEALAVVETQLTTNATDAVLLGRQQQLQAMVDQLGDADPARGTRRHSSRPPRKLAVGRVIAEKYRLEKQLARGAMSSVWVATHLSLDSRVVIKFINTQLLLASTYPEEEGDGDESNMAKLALTRFEREAKAAAQLRSVNVVQVFDYGVDAETPYIVMEYLSGVDMAERIKQHGRLTVAALYTIMSPVAEALQRAHDAGIVHRDLKPQNIFLARDGDREIPKILDFGVAKTMQGADAPVDTSSTLEGTVVGTPHYMSPEQAMGQAQVDARSDTWSLGVIAYHALTGQRPFTANALLETVVAICSAPIVPPSQHVPQLGPAVDEFMKRALARDPSVRFQTAREFDAALCALATGAVSPTASMSLDDLASHGVVSIPSRRKGAPLWLFAAGAALVGGGLAAVLALSTEEGTSDDTAGTAGVDPLPASSHAKALEDTDAGTSSASASAAPAESASAAPVESSDASAVDAGFPPAVVPQPPRNWPPSTGTKTGDGRDVGY